MARRASAAAKQLFLRPSFVADQFHESAAADVVGY
jgi:hypothetical protein